MLDYVQVRLENDFVWEPFLKSSQSDEDAIKEFCRYHPEYYLRNVELDGYKELCIEVRNKCGNIKKYDVYIDNSGNFSIKEAKNLVL